MSNKIPQSLDEITAAIKVECAEYLVYAPAEILARMVVRWREAWLRDAEPRLRPVTENPKDGDVIQIERADYPPGLAAYWVDGSSFPTHSTGWYLLKRKPSPLTHTEALELLVTNIRCLGNAPEYLLVALAKAEEALRGEKP